MENFISSLIVDSIVEDLPVAYCSIHSHTARVLSLDDNTWVSLRDSIYPCFSRGALCCRGNHIFMNEIATSDCVLLAMTHTNCHFESDFR